MRLWGEHPVEFWDEYHSIHPRREPYFDERQQLYVFYIYLHHLYYFGSDEYREGIASVGEALLATVTRIYMDQIPITEGACFACSVYSHRIQTFNDVECKYNQTPRIEHIFKKPFISQRRVYLLSLATLLVPSSFLQQGKSCREGIHASLMATRMRRNVVLSNWQTCQLHVVEHSTRPWNLVQSDSLVKNPVWCRS